SHVQQVPKLHDIGFTARIRTSLCMVVVSPVSVVILLLLHVGLAGYIAVHWHSAVHRSVREPWLIPYARVAPQQSERCSWITQFARAMAAVAPAAPRAAV